MRIRLPTSVFLALLLIIVTVDYTQLKVSLIYIIAVFQGFDIIKWNSCVVCHTLIFSDNLGFPSFIITANSRSSLCKSEYSPYNLKIDISLTPHIKPPRNLRGSLNCHLGFERWVLISHRWVYIKHPLNAFTI